MFLSKKTVKEMIRVAIDNVTPESLGLVRCEFSGLYGEELDMVQKVHRSTVRYYWSAIGHREDRKVFYSKAFAPKWDIMDTSEKTVKYYKIVGPKEVLTN